MNSRLNDFLHHLKFERNYSPLTIDAYQRDLNGFYAFLQGKDKTLAASTPQDIKLWLKKLHSQLHSAGNVKKEISELFSLMINHHFEQKKVKNPSCKLKMEKLALTTYEKKILDAHLINLESFVENIKRDKKRTPPKTKEQNVILWGMGNYASIIRDGLYAG